MTIFSPSWSNFEFRYHHDFLNLNFSAILLRIWRNHVVTRFSMSLFLFEIFSLTFKTFIIVNPPLPLLSSSSWYPLFSSRNSKNLPLLIFTLFRLRYLRSFYSISVAHISAIFMSFFFVFSDIFFSSQKIFLIVKLIIFFYMQLLILSRLG